MKVEFDPNKNLRNIRKRGLAFADAAKFDAGEVRTGWCFASPRFDVALELVALEVAFVKA